jgi:hypothetical protein
MGRGSQDKGADSFARVFGRGRHAGVAQAALREKRERVAAEQLAQLPEDERAHRAIGGTIKTDDAGNRCWYLGDELHRDGGPAVESANGARYWYLNDQFHREDGPAIERASGTREWYLNGKRHREDGPAVEQVNGTRKWFVGGKLHREDGPAVEQADGTCQWWLNGRRQRRPSWRRGPLSAQRASRGLRSRRFVGRIVGRGQ